MRAFRNYFLTSGIFAIYQFAILFCLIFSCIRAYPFVYGPLPQDGVSWRNWDNSHQTLFTLLLVFEIICGSIGVIIVAQTPIELPVVRAVQIKVGETRYEIAKVGDYYSITKGTDNSGLAYLIVRVLIGIIWIPLNLFGALIKLVCCIFVKKYREAYRNLNVIEYWTDMLHLNYTSPARILYSNSFVLVEIILAIVIIVCSYNFSYIII